MNAEQLAIMEQLARIVAHELRNPLGNIKNAAYFLNMALKEPEKDVKEALKILERGVATSEGIINSLLSFARHKPPTMQKVDVNDLVKEVLSHINVPESVEVVSQLDEALPTILADPNQLSLVFKNIILSGIQAMTSSSSVETPEGGRLVVKSEIPSQGWVSISFADTGPGIPQEKLGRLFEPLFTTRAKGIGLGLALAKILVEGHGGSIEVESRVGKGTVFTVKLPVSGK